MKTICIAGKNDIAVNTLDYCIKKYKYYNIICIVNKTDEGINSWQKSLKSFAREQDITIASLEDVYNINDLVFISLEFDRIIRPDRFESDKLYNIHFSLLPQFKGCHTSVLPILFGKNETGVTLHKIRRGIDTGEIIEQNKISILDSDTSLDLYFKFIDEGTKLIIKNLDNLVFDKVSYTKQLSEESTYYPLNYIDYSKVELDTNKTAYQIKNQIRAFCFRPYQIIKWKDYYYIDCKITEEVSKYSPGTIIEDTLIFTRISTIDYDVIMYKDVYDILIDAIKRKDNETAKSLCISNTLIRTLCKDGSSVFSVANQYNNIEFLDFLKSHGARERIIFSNS